MRRRSLPVLVSVLAAAVTAGLAPAAAGAAEGARTLAFACPTDKVGEDGFVDLPESSPHERAADCVVHWGVAFGQTPDRYGPTALVTRAHMATFIGRLLLASGADLPPGRDRFPDDEASPSEDMINRLAEAGIVGGRSDGRYDPNGSLTRGQMAAFLVRAHDYRAAQASSAPLPSDEDHFTDDDGHVFEKAINAAAGAGLTGGTSAGSYSPELLVRREPMASFLARLLDLGVENGWADVPPQPAPRPAPPGTARLAPLPPKPSGEGGYAFAARQPSDASRPIAWSPCSPVRYVVRRQGEPAGAAEIVERAIDKLEAATGLVLQYSGETDEAPRSSRPTSIPQRYGAGYAPVLVAWGTPQEHPVLNQGLAGHGSASWVSSNGGPAVYVSGQLALDAPEINGWRASMGADWGPKLENLVMHELGHVIGLDHVNVPGEVMTPGATTQTAYGPGDRRGLYAVGDGACTPTS